MTELRKLYLYNETTGREVTASSVTDCLVMLDHESYEHRLGESYGVQNNTSSGASRILAFKTPSGTNRIYVVYEFSVESKAHVTVYEGRTWTTNTGTVIAPKQQNRGSDNTSALLEDKTATPGWTSGGVLQDPTGQADGTIISLMYAYAGKFSGDSGGKRAELVLKPDETYSFELASDDGNKGLQIRLYWYEHTDAT